MKKSLKPGISARQKIDEAFARMREDPEYQLEALALAQEFAEADAEAIVLGDAQTP